MTDERRAAELAAMKKIAEGHKLLLHAMLTNNEAYLALLQAAEETSGNSKIQSRIVEPSLGTKGFKDLPADCRKAGSKMKVLR